MTNLLLNEAINAVTQLTETVQERIEAQDVHGAMALAKKRHDALISVLEYSEMDHCDKEVFARTALKHLQSEHLIAKSNAHQDRSNFNARKLAYRAYTRKAA